MLLHLSFVGTSDAKRGGFSAWLLISSVSTQERPDLGWIIDLSKAMYLDYLWCGELNLPLSVLCTCVNWCREKEPVRETVDHWKTGGSRRPGVSIEYLFFFWWF